MDICCFNRPYDDQSPIRNSLEAQAKLHIQARIRSGHSRLAASCILWYENSEYPFIMRTTAISAFLRHYGSVYVSSKRGPIVQDGPRHHAQRPQGQGCPACGLCARCSVRICSRMTACLCYRHEYLLLLNPMDVIRMEADKQ